ncbi:glycoside hydrolase family 7 protein [Cylindrobasidium torrendii FP15055 ss-10]|uniref:Glucanase n=1 Tax=Cylindrobasidium torrendii FP15055 ss-10 TaxID=1314674 RepID=A0A0D7AVE4_9AGAR|nr:glycoside hydrolase family 7 protein [Cylindrobasidium torrendii FP15055 ss-10]
MFSKTALVTLTYLSVAFAQQVGTLTAESHPALSFSDCTEGSCKQSALSVTLDSNWRWLHTTSGSDNCYDGNEWDTSLCPDGETCASNCALDGADYPGTYGITTSGSELELKFVTKGTYSTNVGSRVYLMADDSNYKIFNLKNKEFTFDVDVSNLPCGLNGALYFVEMEEKGGLGTASNKAGAKYGTGYCDAQCPHDIKFINGVANSEGWVPSDNDANAGSGTLGACCSEMDIWEANSISAAYTPHPCSVTGPTACTGTDCGDGDDRYQSVCDKDGCDFNSYRMGDKDFYGPGGTVDTASKFTVVTQFITADNSTTGDLVEIRRLYVQGGKVIQNSVTAVDGIDESDSITTDYCTAQKTAFGDKDAFSERGGLSVMGDALERGMVLVMSIWDDHAVNMLWLDSTYPTDADPAKPGVARGTCATDSGKPEDVEKNSPGASVKFSNIKLGSIGSTY